MGQKTRKITSDLIFIGDGRAIADGIVEIDYEGFILGIFNANTFSSKEIEYYPGAIIPGMINAHCHLELSHLGGRVPTGTGLLPFLKSVVTFRDIDPAIIAQEIKKQDQIMFEQGIVAVGDISNTADTLATKRSSSILYHTFVEMFDFMLPSLAGKYYRQYLEVYEQFKTSGDLSVSATPHAPYTVSPDLFDKINALNHSTTSVSIHNQETLDENLLFLDGSGGFPSFFEDFEIDFSNFIPTGRTSIHYSMDKLDPKHVILMVHNTLTEANEIKMMHMWGDRVYWVTCPNANLYIENRLPDYHIFQKTKAKVAIGTDSITSNWQLSILEEMKTIAKYASHIPAAELVKWATLNGAESLGVQSKLGSFMVGKQPGLVWINTDPSNPENLLSAKSAKRIDI